MLNSVVRILNSIEVMQSIEQELFIDLEKEIINSVKDKINTNTTEEELITLIKNLCMSINSKQIINLDTTEKVTEIVNDKGIRCIRGLQHDTIIFKREYGFCNIRFISDGKIIQKIDDVYITCTTKIPFIMPSEMPNKYFAVVFECKDFSSSYVKKIVNNDKTEDWVYYFEPNFTVEKIKMTR